MIDRITGEILFPADDIRIVPSLTRDLFLDSKFANQSQVLIHNEPYCSFRLPPIHFDGHTYAWSLLFHSLVLQQVWITCTDAKYGSSWSDWSEEGEIERELFHDYLLLMSLGQDWKVEQYAWGKVVSFADPKSGDSSIGVTYY